MVGYLKSNRHAARSRAVQQRMDDLATFMAQYEKMGMSRDEASRKAFAMVKAGIKPVVKTVLSFPGDPDLPLSES